MSTDSFICLFLAIQHPFHGEFSSKHENIANIFMTIPTYPLMCLYIEQVYILIVLRYRIYYFSGIMRPTDQKMTAMRKQFVAPRSQDEGHSMPCKAHGKQ
jgi:hypothetical protein